MGRPVVDSAQITLRMSAEELAAMDAWRIAQDDAPQRTEAIRRLVRAALEASSASK